MYWIKKVFEAGMVKRCHTINTIKTYNNAEHSYFAVMIAIEICNSYNDQKTKIHEVNSANVTKYLLTHDLHEIESGDIPAPMKRASRHFAEMIKEHAYKWRRENLPKFYKIILTDTEKRIGKMADSLELMRFCVEEKSMGSNAVDTMYKKARSYVIGYNSTIRCSYVSRLIMELDSQFSINRSAL